MILFYEYFHGDNGAGLGASHQTGWTGLVARIIQMLGYLRRSELLGATLGGDPGVPASHEDAGAVSAWPAAPGHLRAEHGGVAARRRRARRRARDARRRSRRRVGRRHARRRRRGVADGRVGAQPGRRASWRSSRPTGARRSAPRCPISPTPTSIGSAVLHPPLRGRRALRRPHGLAVGPGRARRRGVRLLRRLRAQPRRPRPSMARPSIPSTSSAAAPTTSPATRRASSTVGDAVIARGRDPYFPPWPDVAQLNAFAPALRARGRRRRWSTSPTRPTGCAATWRC